MQMQIMQSPSLASLINASWTRTQSPAGTPKRGAPPKEGIFISFMRWSFFESARDRVFVKLYDLVLKV